MLSELTHKAELSQEEEGKKGEVIKGRVSFKTGEWSTMWNAIERSSKIKTEKLPWLWWF